MLYPFLWNSLYLEIFHKNEVQTVIFRCLTCLNLNWIQSYSIKLVKNSFFHAWKCIISGLFCRSVFWHLLENQLSHLDNGYFFKILWSFHEIQNQVKCRLENKIFFELSTNEFFGLTFVSFLGETVSTLLLHTQC